MMEVETMSGCVVRCATDKKPKREEKGVEGLEKREATALLLFERGMNMIFMEDFMNLASQKFKSLRENAVESIRIDFSEANKRSKLPPTPSVGQSDRSSDLD
jgi:hypothetical protein